MIRVLLQCEDAYFMQAFSNYASANCHDMEFICFTTPEKAAEYLSSTVLRLDALLAARPVLELAAQPGATRLLVGERTVFSDPQQMQINIYQSGPAIISDIHNALALTGKHLFGNTGGRNVHVAAVYSVQGGSGKTVLSYALAAAAARRGKQALYINLEPFPAFGQLYAQEFSASMDDILFALKSGRDLAPVVLDTMERDRSNVMVLPPFRFAGDLLSLNEEDLKALLQVLAEKTDLEYIFLDLPAGLQPMNQWALENCSHVLQVYTDDAVGREHLKRAEEDVYFKNLPIPGAILTVLNKSRQKGAEENIAAKIPWSESLQQGGTVADVQERNPAFLKSCCDLLEKLD